MSPRIGVGVSNRMPRPVGEATARLPATPEEGTASVDERCLRQQRPQPSTPFEKLQQSVWARDGVAFVAIEMNAEVAQAVEFARVRRLQLKEDTRAACCAIGSKRCNKVV